MRSFKTPLIVMTLILAGCLASPAYEGAESDHFDGKVFHNRTPIEHSPLDMVKLFSTFYFKKSEWPDWIQTPQQTLRPAAFDSGNLHVTFINHSTLLLRLPDINILTDPIFSYRASPFEWAGPQRVRAPGIDIEQLPPIHVILISHNHYDHLDLQSLQQIKQRNQQLGAAEPLILVGLGTGDLLQQEGFQQVKELDWEQSASLNGVEFIFSEARHRSGRGIADQMKSLWGAFVIRTAEGNLYFAGDTGYDDHFKIAGERYGPFKLAMLPIGAYQPRWFMSPVHMNPQEAVQAHQDLQAELSIGIHFGTFQLTFEEIDRPVRDLLEALDTQQVGLEQFQVLDFGETLVLPRPKTTQQYVQN